METVDLYKKVERFVDEATGGSRHLKRTVYWLLRLKPDADDAMLIAAISHDIERAFRDKKSTIVLNSDKGYLDEEHLEYHQKRGAEIISNFLKIQGAEDKLIEKVYHLISKHEVGGDDDQNLIKDADSLSFLENNIDVFLNEQVEKVGKEKVRDKIDWMFERITSEKARKIATIWHDEAIQRIDLL